MRIPDSLVESLLKKSGQVTPEQLESLRGQESSEKKAMQDLAIANNIISEKDLTKLYAAEIDVPFTELNPKEIKKETLQQLPERIARQYNAVVFDIDANQTKLVAMSDPDDVQALNFLQKQLGNNIRIYAATDTQVQAVLEVYRGNVSGELTKVIAEGAEAESIDENVDEEDLAEDSPIAKTVNLLVEYGIKSGASDIHIEPYEKNSAVRFRIDGILREAVQIGRAHV